MTETLLKLDTDVKAMRTIFETHATTSDDMRLQVSKEGINARGMDASHISMIDITLDKAGCENFYIQDTQALAIRADLLVPFVQRLDQNKGRKIQFEIDSGNIIISALDSEFNEQFSIRRAEKDCVPSTPLPRLEFKAVIQMPIGKLQNVVETVSKAGDYIRFEAVPEVRQLMISSMNSDAKADLLIKDSRILKGFDLKEKARAVYSLDYIQKFIRALTQNVRVPVETPLTIEYASKFPLRLRVNFYGVKVDYYLAPRVTDE